jgi:hypothetical protein
MESLITTTESVDMSFGTIQIGTAQNTLWQQRLFDIFIGSPYLKSKLTADPRLIQEIPISPDQSIAMEKKFYEDQKEKYLAEYEGKYIALENGILLDSDLDFSALAKRVYEQHGYRPIFMPFVTKEDRQYKIRSPKFK